MPCRSDSCRSDKRRRYSRFLAGGVVVVASTLACAACGSSGSGGSGGTASGGSVPVGCETDLTGTYATFGAQALQGCQAGTYAVNHAGGVDGGQMIKLIPADDASDPVDAVAPAEKLVNVSHIVAQDGEAGTNAQAIATIFTRAHLPFMMGGGDVFYDKNTNPYIWRISPSDSQLGVAMALWAHHRGYTKAAVLFRTGDVAQSIIPVVTKAFRKLGGTIVSSQIIQADLSSYSSEISKLLSSHPQVIFSEMDPPTETVVFKDLAAAGSNNLPTIGTDDMVGSAMLKGIGIPAARKLMTNVEAGTFKSPALPFYLKAVQASSHQAPQAGSQNTYDGMLIWALAADMAKSTDGATVNADIPKVTAPGGVPVYSYAQGLKELKAGKRITYIGASGPFDFNSYHNIFGPFDAVVATPAGGYKTIYTLTPQALKAIS
jgi:ABC-type branched-subunit amino acid transport system substrate-binding protein